MQDHVGNVNRKTSSSTLGIGKRNSMGFNNFTLDSSAPEQEFQVSTAERRKVKIQIWQFSLFSKKRKLKSELSKFQCSSLFLPSDYAHSFSRFRHNIHKVERIPGSKHKLRKSKYSTVTVPGKTYALNRKNNEMCTSIFADNESQR